MALEIIQAGLQSTIQDLGRFGAAHLGISASGAADPFSLRIGNLLVGNPENTASIEMTLTGGTFRFRSDGFFTLTGSEFKADLEGQPVQFWKENVVKENQVLSIGPTLSGARCCLCIRGGLHVEKILNSASTHLTSGIGGLGGKALQKGNQIELGNLRLASQPIPDLNPKPSIITNIIRVTEGLQWDWFNEQNKDEFFNQKYSVTASSNRMGLRLSGNSVQSDKGNEIITEGIPLGAIQIPGNGQPIISFVEHQTTGGYPKIVNVIGADIHKVGQLKPGDKFQFQLVSFANAQEELKNQEIFIKSLKT